MGESTPKITLEDTLSVFEAAPDPGTPLTASEVADELGCARRTAYGKLEELAERGDLRTKKVGARGRVWWRVDPRPAAVERSETGPLSQAQLDEFVDEVTDYAIFVLDADGRVQTWNSGAQRIKGYTEAEIVDEHFRRFYTEEDREAGVPERNLEIAAEEGRTEDEGLRVKKDGSTFWANVVITALYDDGDVRGYAKVTRDMTERHEYEERLREQRDELDELNQINAVIRDIDQALVTATTREGIDQAVCERLAASGTYSAAWIGEYTEEYEEVTPRAWAGLDEAYIEAIEGADRPPEEPTERGVSATALRTRSVQSLSQISENGRSEPWQADTIAAGFQSAVMIPLVYNDVEYGVLTVYAEEESAFDDRKVAVLSEMGETISHAVAAIRRKERERTLTALQESTRDLLYTESPEEIGDVIVDAVTEDLALADALVYLFDTSENTLEPVSASFPLGSYNGGPEPLAAGDDSPIWTSFVDAEPRAIEVSLTSIMPPTGLDDRQALAIPLGDHGVLAVAAARGETFDEQTRNLVGLVGTTAEAAFDRVESQANLRERDAILQERNKRLQRVNQINTIIREVDQALIRATTREEVQRVVCERLTDSDRFRFAWIGRTDDADGGLAPQAWSGDGRGYLDSVSLREDDNPTEPAVRTARSGDVTVVSNVADDLRSGQWRKEAFTREFQSVISVPLTYEGVTHGVLTVYADRPGVFDEMEQTVFAELGGTIANTLNAVETKQSLLSDEWVELEFRLHDESTSFLSRLAGQVGCTVTFEGFVPLSEGRARLFFTVDGADPDAVRGVIDRSVAVESSQLIASDDGGHLFEAVVGGPVIPLTLMEHGASLRALTVTDEGIRVVVSLPSNEDVRTFIEQFQTEYQSAEFLARRPDERPQYTRRGFRAELEEQLTDRQLEVLQTAHLSGFFASPRRSTGSDIAELLGVSQPTVTEHLRTAQSKILDLLLADQAPDA